MHIHKEGPGGFPLHAKCMGLADLEALCFNTVPKLALCGAEPSLYITSHNPRGRSQPGPCFDF